MCRGEPWGCPQVRPAHAGLEEFHPEHPLSLTIPESSDLPATCPEAPTLLRSWVGCGQAEPGHLGECVSEANGDANENEKNSWSG